MNHRHLHQVPQSQQLVKCQPDLELAVPLLMQDIAHSRHNHQTQISTQPHVVNEPSVKFHLLHLHNAWLDKKTPILIKARAAKPTSVMRNFAPSVVYLGCSLAAFSTTVVQM